LELLVAGRSPLQDLLWLQLYFTAAYKGTDDDVLVWAPPVNKIVSN
jgi:hypothetical protein